MKTMFVAFAFTIAASFGAYYFMSGQTMTVIATEISTTGAPTHCSSCLRHANRLELRSHGNTLHHTICRDKLKAWRDMKKASHT